MQRLSFPYDSLQSDEIRLLRICETSPNDDINLEMATFPMSSCPPYVALSYTWGDESDIRAVRVNGYDFGVRANLLAFLQHATRDINRPVDEQPNDAASSNASTQSCNQSSNSEMLSRFWVDAICINQGDNFERNQQVAKMKEIYENALQVIVWLRSASDDSDLAMESILALRTVLRPNQATPTTGAQFLERSGDNDTLTPAQRASYSNILKLPAVIPAIAQLMNRSWWERAWIIQEATSPTADTSPIIWCGHKKAFWKDFYLGHHYLQEALRQDDHATSILIGNSFLGHLMFIKHSREHAYSSEPLGLQELLSIAQLFDATNPRDKLYSVQRLATKGQHPDLHPRYDLPVEHVYINFAKYAITLECNLDILGFCRPKNNFHLPSWVPDWSVRTAQPRLPKQQGTRQSGYNTVYNADRGKGVSAEFLNGNKILSVDGIEVDTILKLSIPRSWSSQDDVARDGDIAVDWVRFALTACRGDAYTTEHEKVDALNHTLCADINEDDDAEYVERGISAQWPIDAIQTDSKKLDLRSLFLADLAVHRMTLDRRLFWTRKGYLGLGPMHADENDRVCILYGGSVPFILRKNGEYWGFIDECYVHGIMDGEAIGRNLYVDQKFNIR